MKRYIIQTYTGKYWEDMWGCSELNIARRYMKQLIKMGYRTRVVKEM